MHRDEKLMLVAVGIALGNKRARSHLHLEGTDYSEIINAILELPADASLQQHSKREFDLQRLDEFVASLGVNLGDSKPETYLKLIVERANKVSNWLRAKAWIKRKFTFQLLPSGDLHEKIEYAKAIGYRDICDKTATDQQGQMA